MFSVFIVFCIVLSLVSSGMFSVVASEMCMESKSVSVLCFFLSSNAFAITSSVMGAYVLALYSANLSLISLRILAVVSVFMLCDSSARDASIGDAEETITLISPSLCFFKTFITLGCSLSSALSPNRKSVSTRTSLTNSPT